MKNKILIGSFIIYLSLAGASAYAGLIMNITDDGFGNSRFVFSGSATVTSGVTNANGIWLDDTLSFMAGNSGFQSIISGSGTITSSLTGTTTVVAIYQEAGFGFSPIVPGNILHIPGAGLSWSGDLITSTPFSNFIFGIYSTSNLKFGIIANDTYTLTIGPEAPSIPEPGILALFGLGLAGLGLKRHKKAEEYPV